MNKSRILFDLIWFANSRKEFTAEEVSAEFNVSVRTAHRYITDLSDMGIPIYSIRGRNGGYRVLSNQVYPPLLFAKDEIFAILFSFSYLGNYSNLPFDMNIVSVIEKIYSILPDDASTQFRKLDEVLRINKAQFHHDAPFLKEIINAAINKNISAIEYMSCGSVSDKRIVPLGIFAHNSKWYCPGYDMDLKQYRLYRADRITKFVNTNEVFTDIMSLDRWLSDYPVPNPIKLTAELSRSAYLECRDIYFLQSDLRYVSDDLYILDKTIDKDEIPFYTKLILKLGRNAKVKEPADMITDLKDEIRQMAAIYGLDA